MKQVMLLIGTFLPSSVRLWTWRLMGFKVGAGCRVSFMSVVVADWIELENGAAIEPLTFIYRPKNLFLGERCRIAAFVRIIGFGTAVFEAQSFVALGCLIDCSTEFRLGRRSQLGPRGLCYTHGGTDLIFNIRFPHRRGPIKIGADCWLGMGCTVYPQVTIGDRCLIFAGMVVNQDVKEDSALLPPDPSCRIASAALFRSRVDDKLLEAMMEQALQQLAAAHACTVEDKGGGQKLLRLPGGGQVALLSAAGMPRGLEKLPHDRTVLWTLHPPAQGSPFNKYSLFIFAELRAAGPWTPFADSIAAFLCDKVGVHFAWKPAPDS